MAVAQGEIRLPADTEVYGEDVPTALERAGGRDYVVRREPAKKIARPGLKPDIATAVSVSVYRAEDWSLFPAWRGDPCITLTVPRSRFVSSLPAEVEDLYENTVDELEAALMDVLSEYDALHGFED